MNSGLAFEESTGTLNSDLVRMLTQEADMAGFAASQPLRKKPGKKWSYSSGTTNILSRILRHAIDDDQRYWSFPSAGVVRSTWDDDCSSRKRQQWNLGGLIPGVGQRTRLGPVWTACIWIRAAGTASNFYPPTWVRQARNGVARIQSRPMARTGGSAAADQGPICPMTAFQLRAIRDNLLLVAPSQRAVIVRLGQTSKKPRF